MAASQKGGAAVTVSLTEVSAGRDVYITVDTTVRDDQFRRNRSQMLEKVRLIWIKGFLEPSLDQLVRIELGLETKPDTVERPFDLFVQCPTQGPQPLPAGTPISHIFKDAGNALLILGEPGAGKTTLLLELTRDLLDRAAQDERHLIPVVFNLSSWAEQQCALADWLCDELHKRYDVPRKLAKAWVDGEIILPLLDGLDEVAADHRNACVETINAFLQEHGLLPLVVCSRVADYVALPGRLRLPSAVIIQSLSQQQVQSYVDQAGAALVGLRTVLQHDESLWELLNTPLMLSIAALAYQGRSADEIHSLDTGEEHYVQLFAAYTDAMFHRRARTTPYTREQTEHWLTWLARAMKDHNQSIFYVEWMQPNWVPEYTQQRTIKHILALTVAMLSGPPIALFSVLHFRLPIWLIGMVSVGWLLGWLLLNYTPVGRPFTTSAPRYTRGKAYLSQYPRRLAPSQYPRLSVDEIKYVEKIGWPWSAVQFKRRMLFLPITVGLLGGLLGGLGGLLGGLLFGLLFELRGLLFGLLSSLTTVESTFHSSQNGGIKRSMQNALIGGLGGVLLGPLSLFHLGPLSLFPGGGGLGSTLSSGLAFGVLAWLQFGGKACLHHFALRLVLWHNNFAPFNYFRFLDYAAARIFLRKVGGGYVFVHRMLLEYFAAMHQTSAEQQK